MRTNCCYYFVLYFLQLIYLLIYLYIDTKTTEAILKLQI